MTKNQAIKYLYNRGAHLCAYQVVRESGKDKISNFPYGSWKQKFDLDTLYAAPTVGLVPGSLGLIVCDIDVKDGGQVRDKINIVEGWAGKSKCEIPSASGGAHLFYKEDKKRKRKVLQEGVLEDEKLEVFCGDSNFVELHDVVKLAYCLDELSVFSGKIEKKRTFRRRTKKEVENEIPMQVDEGKRNNWLTQLTGRIANSYALESEVYNMAYDLAKRHTDLDDEEIERTINSILKADRQNHPKRGKRG